MNGSRAWLEKDFYAVLGVAEDASAEEIKRAYKTLARTHHPDRNPGDKASEEIMKDISEAYDVLSDPQKRPEYDQLRQLSRTGFAGGGPGTGWQANIRFEDLPFDIEDLFGGIFGGRGARARRPSRGADVGATARISFEEAMRGTTAEVRVGASTVKVKIPPGIHDGARVRARGRGAAGEGGTGDLYVQVEVEPHPIFSRRGSDLLVTVSIPFATAALGGTLRAPTLDGSVSVRVPEGTPTGKTFRVRGRGAPKPRGSRGDLLVTVEVAVPQALSDEQRDLIEKLAALDGSPAREDAGR